MPGLTSKTRNGLRSRAVTSHMIACIEALRTQLDAQNAGAKLGLTRFAIYSNLSNVERKTGWNLFTVTRLKQRTYAWLVDETAASFFAWMTANPHGGKDWPRPPEVQTYRESYARTLSVGRQTVQESSRRLP